MDARKDLQWGHLPDLRWAHPLLLLLDRPAAHSPYRVTDCRRWAVAQGTLLRLHPSKRYLRDLWGWGFRNLVWVEHLPRIQ